MNKKLLISALAVVGLSACAGMENAPSGVNTAKAPKGAPFTVLGPASQPLGAMPMFADHKVGTIHDYVNNKGEAYSWRTEGVNGSRIHIKSSGGCNDESDAEYLHYPSYKWWGCKGDDSENTEVGLEQGTIWPLQLGNSWTVKWRGNSVDGRYWRNTASCEVVAEERVQVPAGEYDAYKVVCTTRSTNRKNRFERVRYYAPGVNSSLAGIQSKNGKVTRSFALEGVVTN